jgi:hypothetical protein
MELTQEQIEFLNGVCEGDWTLNSDGEVDVDGNVFIMGEILKNPKIYSIKEIGIQFGTVKGGFSISDNNLTSLDGIPRKLIKKYTGTTLDQYQYPSKLHISGNDLINYFKNIKEEDFPYWENLDWGDVLQEYPFLINIFKNYSDREDLEVCFEHIPLTKLYYKD